jgi:hypothetical protein
MTNTNEVGKTEVMADSIPLSPVTLPTSIRLQLCKVVARGQKSSWYDGYKIANDALSNWLTMHLGLNTDDNWHMLSGGAFTVNFDWRIQKWVVRA